MKVVKKIFEEVTIYYKDSEKEKAFDFIFNNGYRLTRSGPIVKRLKCVKNSYKIVAQRMKVNGPDFNNVRAKPYSEPIKGVKLTLYPVTDPRDEKVNKEKKE